MYIYPLVHPHTHIHRQAHTHARCKPATAHTHDLTTCLQASTCIYLPAPHPYTIPHTYLHTYTYLPVHLYTHTCSPSACTPPPPPTHWYTHVIGCTHSHLSPQLHALMHLTACLCTQNQIPASLHRHIPVCLKIPTPHTCMHTRMYSHQHIHTHQHIRPPPPPPYTHYLPSPASPRSA